MEKFYIGLANGIHDPAMAVVDSDGEVIYAEGTERPLQNKRAVGLTADLRETVRRVIKEHCNPHAEFVVAKTFEPARASGSEGVERTRRDGP